MTHPFQILNQSSARYECTFGRGCDGVCCRNGRPIIYPEEIEQLRANQERLLPLLRPEASEAIEKDGFLYPRRRRFGQRVLRIVGGWCVFFRDGCVLHRLGAEEGDKFRYKPAVCSLFPIQQDELDRWYVRQRGYKRERWDLFCLDPAPATPLAAETLAEEIALARRFHEEAPADSP